MIVAALSTAQLCSPTLQFHSCGSLIQAHIHTHKSHVPHMNALLNCRCVFLRVRHNSVQRSVPVVKFHAPTCPVPCTPQGKPAQS